MLKETEKKLGTTPKIRNRRIAVFKRYVKGFTYDEISEELKIGEKTVIKDIRISKQVIADHVPVEMIRDLGNSFYNVKIKELEQVLVDMDPEGRNWVQTQRLIKDYKEASMKLSGAIIERIEDEREVKVIFEGMPWLDENCKNTVQTRKKAD